jgi:hypothetical protein
LNRTAPNAFGGFSTSWNASAPSPGSVPQFAPAKVVDVVVWGSGWTSNFLNAVSQPGAVQKGYSIMKAAAQLQPIPWANVDRVSVVFDKDVAVDSFALAVRGTNIPSYPIGGSANYNGATKTATWTVVGSALAADRFILDLDDARVAVAATGANLDGNWVDGSGAASSGDNKIGGDFEFHFNILAGDVDGDGTVEQSEFTDVRVASRMSIGDGGYNTRLDIDGNGVVNLLDLLNLNTRLGASLPVSSPGSPEAPTEIAAPLAVASRTPVAAATRRLHASPLRAADVDRIHQQEGPAEVRSEPQRLLARRGHAGRRLGAWQDALADLYGDSH